MRRRRRHPTAQDAELAPADRRQHVAHPIVEADRGVLVVRGGIAGLGGEEAAPLDQGRVVGDEHAAAGRGDDLVAVEREHRPPAKRAGHLPPIGRAERLGRVLDQGHVVAAQTAERCVVVGSTGRKGPRRSRLAATVPAAARSRNSSRSRCGSMFQVAASASMKTGRPPS